MKTCAVCGKPLNSGVVVHPECVPHWISVKDRLPEEPGMYLVFAPNYKKGSSRGKESHGGIMFSHFSVGLQIFNIEIHSYNKDCVTHWMPLPEPPKEKEICD